MYNAAAKLANNICCFNYVGNKISGGKLLTLIYRNIQNAFVENDIANLLLSRIEKLVPCIQ
jgi:hypothetical protein